MGLVNVITFDRNKLAQPNLVCGFLLWSTWSGLHTSDFDLHPFSQMNLVKAISFEWN